MSHGPTTPSDARLFKSWLLFFLVSTVGTSVAGAIIWGILGFLLGAAGLSPDAIHWAARATSFIVSLPISYGAFRWAVLHLHRCPPAPHT
jgi:hypothetical protein